MINYWQLGGTLDLGTYPKNQEMQFSLSDLDTEERFRNIQGTRHQGDPRWTADNVSYKYNSNGFRSREFDLNESRPIILTLGCSHTVGVGIPLEISWGHQFGNKFPNHVVYNAGLGGASADTVARLAINMIPLIKPDIVAILWPSRYRFETYNNGPVFNGAWYQENIKEAMNLQYEDTTAYNNQNKNKVIIQLLQKVFKFTELSIDVDLVFETYLKKWELARDGMHLGFDWHQQVANDFYLEYLYRDQK